MNEMEFVFMYEICSVKDIVISLLMKHADKAFIYLLKALLNFNAQVLQKFVN